MVESAVHFHERLYFPSSNTAGDRAFVGPAAENGPLKPAAATYLPHRDIESQAISAPNQIDDPSEARVDSHDAEKNPFERHSLSSHGLSYNHSRVTCGDDEVDDGPQEHAIWILVGNPPSDKISSR